MWFYLSLPVIFVSFEFIKVSLKAPFGFCWEIDVLKIQLPETFEKNCGRKERNFSKFSLHFKKIPNSLRQVLQTYSGLWIFVYYKKKCSRNKDWSQSSREILCKNWWRCDEIYIIVNLGQKYEGNWRY